MSRKKAERKYRERVIKSAAFRMKNALEEARDFIETATPFEISLRLTELGVSTVHRAGIEALLDQTWRTLLSSQLTAVEYCEAIIGSLTKAWSAEIHAKNRHLIFEERLFLIETAQHMTVDWFGNRQAHTHELLNSNVARLQKLSPTQALR